MSGCNCQCCRNAEKWQSMPLQGAPVSFAALVGKTINGVLTSDTGREVQLNFEDGSSVLFEADRWFSYRIRTTYTRVVKEPVVRRALVTSVLDGHGPV